MTNISLPAVSPTPNPNVKLPFGGEIRTSDKLVFSFACFDRSNKLFNLGAEDPEFGMVPPNWFVDFLDCLKNVSVTKVYELRNSMYDLHPVDWKHANVAKPEHAEQCEFWQFRINKSKGRIIGILIEAIFYIVWLDPHHNLTDSDGYRGATYYAPAKSQYEKLMDELERYRIENVRLKDDLKAAELLLDESKEAGK